MGFDSSICECSLLIIYLYNNGGRCAPKVRQKNKRRMLHRQKLFELQNDLYPLKPKLFNIILLMSVYLRAIALL